MKKYYLILCIAMTVHYVSFSQQYEAPKTLPSPNVASLGIYGAIPTNNFTGIPSIGIPLYTVQEQDINIPISLNYHVGEVKLGTIPSWTGLGWSLSSAGSITRSVNVVPDEIQFAGFGQNRLGYFENKDLLNDPRYTLSAIAYGLLRYNIPPPNNFAYEVSADDFHFNFLGYSGSFLLDKDGNWQVKSDSNIKVVFNIHDNNNYLKAQHLRKGTGNINDAKVIREGLDLVGVSKGQKRFIKGFTLITDDGTRYIFGGANATEYTTGYREQDLYNHSFIPTTWHLTKVISPSGNEATFTYEAGNPVCSLTKGVSSSIISYSNVARPNGTPSPLDVYGSYYSSSSLNYGNGSIIFPVYLKTIQSKNTRIDFESSNRTSLRYSIDDIIINPEGNGDSISFTYLDDLDDMQWRQLNQIRITNLHHKTIKEFQFVYNSSETERSKLAYLLEFNRNVEKKYSFIYNSNKIPYYLDFNSDHWGFYNNRPIRNSEALNPVTYKLSKAADPSGAPYRAETLEKIIYPTGGATEFVYEPHRASKVVNKERHLGLKNLTGSNQNVGGLRIRSIINRDVSNEITSQKDYYYVKGYRGQNNISSLPSSGILNSESAYSIGIDHNQLTIESYSTHNKIPGTFNSFGSHVGYSEVAEVTRGNGYSIHTYTNYDVDIHNNTHYDELPINYTVKSPREPGDRIFTIYSKFTDKSLERGKLTSVTNYNESNKKVSEEVLYYDKVSDDYSAVVNVDLRSANNGNGPHYSYAAKIKKYHYNYRVVKKEEHSFDKYGNKRLTATNEYRYNPQKLIAEQRFINSEGDSTSTHFKYPFDITPREAQGNQSTYHEMVDAHILNPAVLTTQNIDNQIISQQLVTFDKFGETYYPKNVLHNRGRFGYRYRTNITFEDYYDNGKVKEVIDKKGVSTSYIWGYNGEYLIAKLENATSRDIQPYLSVLHYMSSVDDDRTTGYNGKEGNLRKELDRMREKLPNAMITTYTFDPLIGITSITGVNGYTNYYQYDELQRLKFVKDDDGNLVSQYKYNYKGH